MIFMENFAGRYRFAAHQDSVRLPKFVKYSYATHRHYQQHLALYWAISMDQLVCIWLGFTYRIPMRIVVTLATDTPEIDQIMWYCWQHEKHGLNFSLGSYIDVGDHYYTCKIDCEPNKYVDLLLLQWADYLVVV
jgi:hypothetical protein